MIPVIVDTAVVVPVNVLPLTDDVDFKTRKTSVAYNAAGMDLVWNFVTPAGAVTQTAVTPTTSGVYDWAHAGDGMYTIEIPASGGGTINNDTEGTGYFSGVATGVLSWRGPNIVFASANAVNSFFGLDRHEVDVKEINSGTTAAANLKTAGDNYSATRGLTGTALPDAAADAAGGLPISDAGGLDIDTFLARLDADITSRQATIWSSAGATVNLSGTTVKTLTDAVTLPTIPTAWITAAGIQTAAFEGAKFSAGAIAAIQNGLSTLTQAGVRTAVGLASANLDTQLGTLATTTELAKVPKSDGSTTWNSTALASINAEADAALSDYGAAKPGDEMDLVDAPNATAVAVLQDGLATLAKLTKYFQLALRKDAAITTDNATELGEINADGGSGAGGFANQDDAQEAIADAIPDVSGLAEKTDLPANFEDMAITETTGKVTVGTNDDKDGYALTGDYDAAKTAAQPGDITDATGIITATINAGNTGWITVDEPTGDLAIENFYNDALLIITDISTGARYVRWVAAHFLSSGDAGFNPDVAYTFTPVAGDTIEIHSHIRRIYNVAGKILGGGSGTITGTGARVVDASGNNVATAAAQTTAQSNLNILTGTDGATLATAQPNYAPAKAGDVTDARDYLVNEYLETIEERIPAELTADGLMPVDVVRYGGTLQSNGDLPLKIDDVKNVTTKLDTMIEYDEEEEEYKFTEPALENAPTGGGGGASAEDVRVEMDANSTKLALITEARMGALTDWIDGGRLDLILDARASQSSVDSLWTTALTEAYRSTGATGTAAQLLYELIAHLGNSSITSTTKTLKRLDKSTTAKTFTLDDDAAPTAIEETT